jgi:hypothetical protein
MASLRMLVPLYLAVLALLVPAASSTAKPRGDHRDRAVRGTAITDGVVTPGALETLAISRMPKHLQFQVRIAPPWYRSPKCPGPPVFCLPELVEHPGRNPTLFRSSGRGRATIVFTMPSGFTRMLVTSAGLETEFLNYEQGEVVQIEAIGLDVSKKGVKNGRAVTDVTVALNPAS